MNIEGATIDMDIEGAKILMDTELSDPRVSNGLIFF